MQSGKLRHRIALQSNTPTINSFSEPVDSWSTYKTVWGSIIPIKGKEVINADQVDSETKILIRIRYNSSVIAQHRAVHNDIIYDINTVDNPAMRNVELLLYCTRLT